MAGFDIKIIKLLINKLRDYNMAYYISAHRTLEPTVKEINFEYKSFINQYDNNKYTIDKVIAKRGETEIFEIISNGKLYLEKRVQDNQDNIITIINDFFLKKGIEVSSN